MNNFCLNLPNVLPVTEGIFNQTSGIKGTELFFDEQFLIASRLTNNKKPYAALTIPCYHGQSKSNPILFQPNCF